MGMVSYCLYKRIGCLISYFQFYNCLFFLFVDLVDGNVEESFLKFYVDQNLKI